MQASIIKDTLSKVCNVEKLVKLVKEMNGAGLDFESYKGNVWDYLESLPKDEFVEILNRLIKEEKGILGGYGNQQDLENEDASDKGSCSGRKFASIKDSEGREECLGGHDEQADDVGTSSPPNLEDQNPSVDHHGYNYPEVKRNRDNRQNEHRGLQDQQSSVTSQDASGRNRKEDSKGENEQRRKQTWEFPSPSSEESQHSDSEDQQCPVDPISSYLQDDHVSSNSRADNLVESDEELSDSNPSSGHSGSSSSSTRTSITPSPVSPVQALADDNRSILRAAEHDHLPEPSGQRSGVQGTPNQLPAETRNLQKLNLGLIVERLSETNLIQSQVILEQANQQSQQIQQACSNCVALQEEKDELDEQVVNLEQHCQHLQEQIAADEEVSRNQESQITSLRQCHVQLNHQNAALEDVVQTQNEEKKGDEKIKECLVKKIKKLQEDCNMANKRAYEVAQKREEELGVLQNTLKYMKMTIEEIHRNYLVEKDEKEMLKRKLEELEEKWKEKKLDEPGSLSVRETIGHVHQARTQLRDLQHRLCLRFLGDEEKGLNPRQNDKDDID